MKLTSILLLAFLLAAAPRVEALEHWFTYSGGYSALGGDDFDGIDPGPTMGVRYSARVWSNLHAGVGGDLSRYRLEVDELKRWQTDAMATLRWYVPIRSWGLFVDGYGGYSQYSYRTDGGKLTGRGLMWGASAGVAIPVNGAFIDLSIDANQQAYGDIDSGGEPADEDEAEARANSDSSGYRTVLRIGLRIPLN